MPPVSSLKRIRFSESRIKLHPSTARILPPRRNRRTSGNDLILGAIHPYEIPAGRRRNELFAALSRFDRGKVKPRKSLEESAQGHPPTIIDVDIRPPFGAPCINHLIESIAREYRWKFEHDKPSAEKFWISLQTKKERKPRYRNMRS